MLSRLNQLDLCRLFKKLNDNLDYYSVKKSPHKSNSLRRESISKLPWGMAQAPEPFVIVRASLNPALASFIRHGVCSPPQNTTIWAFFFSTWHYSSYLQYYGVIFSWRWMLMVGWECGSVTATPRPWEAQCRLGRRAARQPCWSGGTLRRLLSGRPGEQPVPTVSVKRIWIWYWWSWDN